MSEIRDYMAEYIASREILDPAEYYVQNWSLEPAGLYEQIGGPPAALPESGGSTLADVAYVLMLAGSGLVVLGVYLLRRRVVKTR
jgi:hypothetical protein